jgi:hypothetical protein
VCQPHQKSRLEKCRKQIYFIQHCLDELDSDFQVIKTTTETCLTNIDQINQQLNQAQQVKGPYIKIALQSYDKILNPFLPWVTPLYPTPYALI